MRLAIIVGVLAAVIFEIPFQVVPRDADKELLERRTHGLSLYTVPTVDAVRHVLSDSGVPGGIAQQMRDSRSGKTFLIADGSDLRQVLNHIVKVDDQFVWSIERGVVNFLPKLGKHTLLDTGITEFESGNATTMTDAANRLLRLPEVQARMREIGLTTGYVELGMTVIRKDGKASDPERLNVRCRKSTLRQALNEIVRKQGSGVWLYEEYPSSRGRAYRITFIVQ